MRNSALPVNRTLNLILLLVAALNSSLAHAQNIRYPETRKVDVADKYHGVRVADPYRWLEDTNSAETASWVKAQNEVTFEYLAKLPERERFKSRLTKLWNYPRFGVPFKEGGCYFYFKNDGLQNQDILYVQRSLDAEPRVLIDPNGFSKDGTVALSGIAVSEDGKHIAYGIAQAGSDWKEVKVRQVVTGEDMSDHLKYLKWSSTAWTHDHKGFFYSRFPEPKEGQTYLEANRNQKLYYHVLGQPQSQDVLVYERPDQPEWGIGAEVSDDGRYAILYLSHGTDPKNRIYYIDLDSNGEKRKTKNENAVVKLLDDFDANYDFIGNDGTVFYFRTDLGAPRSKVIAIDITRPERSKWRTILPESKDLLETVSLAGNELIADYLHDAYSLVRVYDFQPGIEGPQAKLKRAIKLPTLGSAGGFGGERSEIERFYSFNSFFYPPSVFRYDVSTGKSEPHKKPDVDFDPSQFETKQVWYASKDGTRIPMFVTHRKGIELNGRNPTYLYGYGGFNSSMTPGFSVSRLIWMENGGVFAMPNLRGGGEYGEEWHQAGTKLRKQNVFDDFIAAAEFLIKKGYTSPKHLTISGGSNGGLLVGAVMNQRPDLFGCALPAVGVMDMLRFHKFTIGWAWKSDYGSSEDPAEFKALYAYSPLHNLKKGTCYPPTLVTTGDHDDRVVPGHSFKYAAALQEAQDCPNPVLIRIETRAGHGAGKPTDKIIEEAADTWAFAMRHTGLAFNTR